LAIFTSFFFERLCVEIAASAGEIRRAGRLGRLLDGPVGVERLDGDEV
jgi:hypothetical protein